MVRIIKELSLRILVATKYHKHQYRIDSDVYARAHRLSELFT